MTNRIIIAGGGLAGLTAAIHLAQKGQKITLFEKDAFPRHKVCGEYLSREVIPYFDELKIPWRNLNPKKIDRLRYSTPSGKAIDVDLPMGALGVSRYALDNLLFETAKANGVEILQEKVLEMTFLEGKFKVISSKTEYTADYVFGSFGKRSVLDKNLERNFFKESAPWVAVKNHYRLKDFPDDLVGLHNFKGGYCGLSRTENGNINMCYLATYESFKDYKDPDKFNEKVLRKNPFLDRFLAEAVPVFEKPLTIAQISFSKKEAVKDHVLMLGDAAGLIHPLCGNGMAIAIHSAKIASEEFIKHIETGSHRQEMETAYKQRWEKIFSRRFKTASLLQKVLLRENLAEISQALISRVPFLLPKIIKQTHGEPIA
ncbi:NAD(P)/FAD-dependent oxidoreductase [Salinimicrobium sp. MT39]|uniref:NAD(P)/FAD-dependent oxidoreductase n=1 Tax=Salinimicrobium profundisediminis TaxID=2994553 RepID=A0A9X3CUT5_9FLAO|nr:NAD(P)/FAD-dependent oxidoreductase [Salinimicrobium profundisediminis]MCX2837061.1 NAD(P)/FAD-dependent oxidoreductase [Salinimicrobium profundisediminis]